MSSLEVEAFSGRHDDRLRIAFINAGSLLAQIVQIAGFPTLFALVLSRLGYPSWLIGAVLASQWFAVLVLAPFVPRLIHRSAFAGRRRRAQRCRLWPCSSF